MQNSLIMKNKSIVIWLTIAISLLCVFFLTYTWKANSINDAATKYATSADGKVVPAKRQAYIDSLWKEKVFLGSTTEEVFKRQLQKGLDLQGGLHVILEVSPVEIIKSLSGNSTDANFRKALADAEKAQATSSDNINDLFFKILFQIGNYFICLWHIIAFVMILLSTFLLRKRFNIFLMAKMKKPRFKLKTMQK